MLKTIVLQITNLPRVCSTKGPHRKGSKNGATGSFTGTDFLPFLYFSD